LLTVVILIIAWLRQLSNWRKPILSCHLTPSDTVTERWWCAKGFWSLFSLLRQLHTVSYSVVCSANIFSSVN